MAPKIPLTPGDDGADDDLAQQVAALQAQVATLVRLQTHGASEGGDGISPAVLEAILLKVAQTSADAAERAANPSNRTHPGISHYSYPEGDRERPRAFKYPMVWAGQDLGLDTTSAEEIDLFNLAEPGTYQFLRTDGTPETLTATATRDASGAVRSLSFDFAVDERTNTLPGIAAMLRGAYKVASSHERELAAMKAQLEAMQVEVAKSHALLHEAARV